MADNEPQQYNYLFASKDTLNNRLMNWTWRPRLFRLYHHRRGAPALRPTVVERFSAPARRTGSCWDWMATPGRMDGTDITQDFDGTISARGTCWTGALKRQSSFADPLQQRIAAGCRTRRGVQAAAPGAMTRMGGRRHVAPLAEQPWRRLNPNCVSEVSAQLQSARALLLLCEQGNAWSLMKPVPVKSHFSGFPDKRWWHERHRKQVVKDLKTRKINYLFVVDINEGGYTSCWHRIVLASDGEATIFFSNSARSTANAKVRISLPCLISWDSRGRNSIISTVSVPLMGTYVDGRPEEIKKGFPRLPSIAGIELEREAKQSILRI